MENVDLAEIIRQASTGAVKVGLAVEEQYKRGLWWSKHKGLARATGHLLYAFVLWHKFTGWLPVTVLKWMRARHEELQIAQNPERWREKMRAVETLGFLGSFALGGLALMMGGVGTKG